MPSINNIKGSDGTGAAAKATLTSPRSVSSTAFTVDSVTSWPDTFIAAAGTPNISTGVIDPATLQVFFGHLSGTDIIIDSFAPGYSDLGNSSGDIIVVKPTTAWADELAAVLEVAHNDDGTLKSGVIDEAAAATLDTGRTAINLRVKTRATATASTTTLTPNIDNYNVYDLTAQAAALTIANPVGTPNNGDVLIIRIKDNGTSRAISYGTAYVNISGLDSLTATTVSKWHTLGVMYNSDASKWHVVSISTEA